MKQLLNYINEALIKKDTNLVLLDFVIFIPWNSDYREFRMSDKINDFDCIRVKNTYGTTDNIWIIKLNDIEKIKQYTKLSETKIYYPPVKYSKEQFIQNCSDHKITLKDIREYKEYQI